LSGISDQEQANYRKRSTVDLEQAKQTDVEPARPAHMTFKDNLLLKLRNLDRQVQEEDHMAARRLDLDIRECVLDTALKEQIIRNQPVANLAMLYDMLGQQGDPRPYERFKETLMTEEERLKQEDNEGWPAES